MSPLTRRSFLKSSACGTASGWLATAVGSAADNRDQPGGKETFRLTREIPVEKGFDLVVAGGGPAGAAAAICAARLGAKVALVQDRPVLGGNASSEIRMHICGADTKDNTWRETGILEELRLESLAWNDEHIPYHLDLALYDACRREPNIQPFLNAQMTECKVDPRLARGRRKRVVSCDARELTSDRTIHIEAGYFVDASGDGALAFTRALDRLHHLAQSLRVGRWQDRRPLDLGGAAATGHGQQGNRDQ